MAPRPWHLAPWLLLAACSSAVTVTRSDVPAAAVDVPAVDVPAVDVPVVDVPVVDVPAVDVPAVDVPAVDDGPARIDVPPDAPVVPDVPTVRCGAVGQPCCPDSDPSCVASLVCALGTCQPCPTGRTPCNGVCVDVVSDRANCGACGRRCPDPTCCTRGVCGAQCSPGSGDCDANCANGCETSLATDLRNCGSCGTVCFSPSGPSACVAGACVSRPACGFADCDNVAANGLETDTSRDACNCGACGRRCEELPGVASARCESCGCAFTCHDGFGDCDGDSANGCEVTFARSASHCGACGRACPAVQACSRGACIDSPTYSPCGGRQANVQNDVEHCGACGHACPAGQPCSRGACVAACPTSATFRCGTETCIDLAANPLHCGGCGHLCPAGGLCSAGSCAFGCTAGSILCAATCVDPQTDPRNCGACGNTCPVSAVCRSGACQSTTCARRT